MFKRMNRLVLAAVAAAFLSCGIVSCKMGGGGGSMGGEMAAGDTYQCEMCKATKTVKTGDPAPTCEGCKMAMVKK